MWSPPSFYKCRLLELPEYYIYIYNIYQSINSKVIDIQSFAKLCKYFELIMAKEHDLSCMENEMEKG